MCWVGADGVLHLQEPSSIEKIAEVDTHIGAAMSGLTADARTLVDHARVEAQVRCCSILQEAQNWLSSNIQAAPELLQQRPQHA